MTATPGPGAPPAGPRTITRFSRSYEEFDPDGAGGGPSTWILSTAGAGGGGGPTTGVSGGQPLGLYQDSENPPVALEVGAAVFMAAAGEVRRAVARLNPAAPAPCYRAVGLSATRVVPGQPTLIATDGAVAQNDWSAVAPAALLQVGARYYLDPVTPGKITPVCPGTPGDFVVMLGKAVSETLLEIEIDLIARI